MSHMENPWARARFRAISTSPRYHPQRDGGSRKIWGFGIHVSAGRLPTTQGLRYFVDGILEIGTLSAAEQAVLESQYTETHSMEGMLDQASRMLSGLSSSAGLVVAPKADKAIRHIEFVSLAPTRALAIIVPEDGMVENRVMELPAE